MTGPLYMFTRWCLSLLPVDEAGRRVFDQTLADWRSEAAKSIGPVGRFFVAGRAVFSVFRSVVGVSFREVVLIRQSGFLSRVFLWVAAYLVLMTVIAELSPAMIKLSLQSRAYLLVSPIAFFCPIAFLLATGVGRTRRPVPALGASLVALAVGVPLLGWAMPIANRTFMQANFGTVTESASGVETIPYRVGDGLKFAMDGPWTGARLLPPPSAFGNDLTVTQVGAIVVAGPKAGGWSAIRWLSFFGAYIVVCVLTPIVASALRRSNGRFSYTLLAVTAVLLFVHPWQHISFDEFSVTWWFGSYWIPVIWMSLCLIAVTRRSLGAADLRRSSGHPEHVEG